MSFIDSIKNLSKIDIQDLGLIVRRSSYTVYALFVFLAFLVIYFTYVSFKSNIDQTESNIAQLKQQIVQAQRISNTIGAVSLEDTILSSELLSFLQSTGQRNSISVNQMTMTPKLSTSGELVSVIYRSIDLSQLISLVEAIQKYNNIGILTIDIEKPFATPESLNLELSVIKY